MEDDILKEIAEDLKGSLKEQGKFIKLSYDDYEPVEINKDNFKEIVSLDINKKIAFIDGGNAEILKSSNFSLQFIRVYATIYQHNKRISNKKHEFYLLVKSFDKEGKIFFRTKIFGDKIIDELEFDSFDKTLTQGKNRVDISFIGNVMRRFAELNLAKEIGTDIIVLDGNLEARYTGEKEILDELYSKGTVCGLSKTCELFTDKGGSFINALRDIEPEKAWYYHPVAKHNQPQDMVFTKLNSKSKYIFRFDISKDKIENVEEVLGLLKSNSKDPVFIGYPYGLIEADRFARISNKELELLKTRFMIKAGKDWRTISDFLKTKDSHNVLDNIG